MKLTIPELLGNFRVLRDNDSCKPGEIVTYYLTPAEIEKRYGHIKGDGKRPVVPKNWPKGKKRK